MSVPQPGGIHPDRACLPAVREQEGRLSAFRISLVCITEHVVVFIFWMKIDLEIDDGAAVQCSAHSLRCDPWVKADRCIIGTSGGAQAASQKDSRQEIGGSSEPSQNIAVPVNMFAAADLRALEEELLFMRPCSPSLRRC